MKSKLLLAALLSMAVFTLSGCMVEKLDENGNVITPTPTVSTAAVDEQVVKEDIRLGSGDEAKVGDEVKVHYVGTLTDGTKFDSSRDKNTPFPYTIGQEGIIKGWETGIAGMKVGGSRKITIPPSLGYGSQPYGKIPANSTLIFEIELLEITKK